MRPSVVALLAILAGSVAAAAQPAPQNMLIRQWPMAGKWRVLLVRARSLGGAPACLLLTGYPNFGEPASQTWGFRSGGAELLLIMNARQVSDVAGADVAVAVDGNQIGRFPVTDRPPLAGRSTAVASLTDVSSRKRILGLIQAGRSVRFTNSAYSFEEVLDAPGVAQFEECRHGSELLS